MKRVIISGVLAFTVLSASAQAFAQEAGAAAAVPEAPAPKQIEGSAGLKLLAGANVWTTPTNVPAGYDALGFAGSGAGFGWGAALYGEGRFFQHLGVELDLGYDNSTLLRNITYSSVVKVTEKVKSSGPRISLLMKGILPTQFGRLWFGIGPEFVLPSSVSASNEITEGRELTPNAAEVENAISAKKENSTMLALVLGMVFHAGDKIEIPVDIRAAKNLSQESDWQDRVKFSGINYEVKAQNSWDFRLAVGAGYRF
jgi:hypothetical protein